MIAFGILKDDFYLMAVERVQGIWDERPETQEALDEIQEQVASDEFFYNIIFIKSILFICSTIAADATVHRIICLTNSKLYLRVVVAGAIVRRIIIFSPEAVLMRRRAFLTNKVTILF